MSPRFLMTLATLPLLAACAAPTAGIPLGSHVPGGIAVQPANVQPARTSTRRTTTTSSKSTTSAPEAETGTGRRRLSVGDAAEYTGTEDTRAPVEIELYD